MNDKQSKAKNNLFFVMTALNVVAYFNTSLSSYNYNSNDITTLLILSSIMIIFSCIGLVLGIRVVKSHSKESNSIKSIILIVLLIVNIIILFRAIILTIFAFL